MEDIFNRRYSLTIGRAQQLILQTVPGSIIRPGGIESTPSPAGAGATLPDGSYQDFIIKPSGAITLTDLRITANIEYTKEGKTNKQTTTIKIYNLSDDNREFIRAEDTVLLRAGYDRDGDTPPLVFVGQVKSVTTERKGTEVITKLLCVDGEVAKKNIRISRRPNRDETSRDIAEYFAAVAADNGIPTGNVFVPVEIPYPSGLPMLGNLFTLMEEFCDRNNLQSYVSLGRLYIEPIDSSPVVSKVNIEEINVKDSIQKEDDSSGKTSSTSNNRAGIKVTLFLNGNISLNTVVDILFGDYRGQYDITSINHVLDFEGKKWDTIVSCIRRG